MTWASSTQGARIRDLFGSASNMVAIIAPFIRVDALETLLTVIPAGVTVRCVTRWRPREVAAGISDPEILDVLEKRGNFRISLVDRLHAKIFIAGNKCLVGSSNVTFAGFGERGEASNIEVLVETDADDPSVLATLNEISQTERPATREMAHAARRLAENLLNSGLTSSNPDAFWFPSSQRPQDAYLFHFQPPDGYLKATDKILMVDLARSNVPPGLTEEEFRAAIRSLLMMIPIADNLLSSTEDLVLTRAEAISYLETIAGQKFSTNDLWVAFVAWMAHFFPDEVMKQEISEVGLRRAQLLKD